MREGKKVARLTAGVDAEDAGGVVDAEGVDEAAGAEGEVLEDEEAARGGER